MVDQRLLGNMAATDRVEAPTEPRKQVFIKTFGCQMNSYDSQKLARILEAHYDCTDNPAQADLILINTCSVRDKPEQKLYSEIGRFRELKRERSLMIGVGGCVAQQEGQQIVKRCKEVDFVFGTHNLSLVPALIERRKEVGLPQVAVDYRDEWEDLPLGFSGLGRVSVFVAISRGCDKNCSYCIVPRTRGPEVSRDPDEIEREIKIAIHRGAREVVLLGQTVNSYGRDLSPKTSFVALLERLSKLPELLRIRFTSPHPQEVRRDFIELIRTNPKICRHIHLPLQSGSDRILKLMNRNYRTKRYLEIIDALRSAVPEIAFTTDVIVGFPGESEADFRATMDLINAVEFDSCFSFMYSPRPGTAAAKLKQLPGDVKSARLQILQERQDQITSARLQAWKGRSAVVLWEGPSSSDSSCPSGRISQNIVVNACKPLEHAIPGSLSTISINAVARYTLRGE